ncbi:MAG: hypothetical protein M3525_11950 [Acidobacteriota bacterium]|nr:hypothetical protein [Acidobacteriota bacterium]
MNLAGLKDLLDNTAELLKSNATESVQPVGVSDVSVKNKNGEGLRTSISYDNRAIRAVTNRFVESQNTNKSVAASTLKLYSTET